MNCQDAQSMVLNFINNKLDKEETKEFIEHIRSCKDCWEELEIYYVMLIGLKQLDEGEELAADFKEKLQNEVDSRYLEIEKNSKRKYAAKIVIVLTIAAMLIWMFVYLVFCDVSLNCKVWQNRGWKC